MYQGFAGTTIWDLNCPKIVVGSMIKHPLQMPEQGSSGGRSFPLSPEAINHDGWLCLPIFIFLTHPFLSIPPGGQDP